MLLLLYLFLQVVQSGLVPSLLAYLTRPDPEVGHSAHPTTLNTSQGISTVKSFAVWYVQCA
jgi:hypothetical protein